MNQQHAHQAAAAIPATLRHRIEKLAARYSRRLGYEVGVEYGATDCGQEWAAVGTNVTAGLLVSVLAGAGTSGGHVLTDRTGRPVGGATGEQCPRRLMRRAEGVVRVALRGA